MNYPDTYYAKEMGDIPQRGSLRGDLRADVCVIGAGLAGVTTALELSRMGKSVILLESHRVGWGASGRNGGSVLDGFAQNPEEIAKKLGPEKAAELHRLSCDGVSYIRRQIKLLKITGAINGTGRYSAMRHHDIENSRQQVVAANTPVDKGVLFLDQDAAQKILNTKKYRHAIFDPAGFHIQPLRYVLGLARETERLGGQIFEATEAEKLEKQKDAWRVKCATGTVLAGHVVLCTSGYDFSLYPKVSRAMLPIATYVMATAPMPDKLDTAIKTGSAIMDTRRSGDYYRRLKNGRLVWGGRITTRTRKPAKLAKILTNDVLSVYPQLAPLEPEFSWQGLMGYATHKMPLIGEVDKNLWMATAFGGHGLNTTAMAGCLIASAIAKDDKRYRLFSPYQPVHAGGFAGRVGAQLIYWYMRWRDSRDERGPKPG